MSFLSLASLHGFKHIPTLSIRIGSETIFDWNTLPGEASK